MGWRNLFKIDSLTPPSDLLGMIVSKRASCRIIKIYQRLFIKFHSHRKDAHDDYYSD